MSPPKRRPTLVHLTPLAAIGGCEINCLRLIEGCPGYDHQVVVFADRGPISEKWEQVGATVVHLRAWDQSGATFRRVLAEWVATQVVPDGIFCWSTSRLPNVLRAISRWPVPCAVYLGNPTDPSWLAAARRRVWESTAPTSPRVSLGACSEYVAVSHRSAAFFRTFPTKVIYNAVDPRLDRPRTYRPLPPGSRPRIGMVARLDPIKDHRTAIRAIALLAAVRPDVCLELAGDGPLRPVLEREVARLGVGENVRFLGFADVAAVLPQWDLYLHATTAAEGMGTALAEAMTSGLPCVATDLAMMREVGGAAGAIYTPPGEAAPLSRALVRLIEVQADREKLGVAGQRRARAQFSPAEMTKAYLQLIGAPQGAAAPAPALA